ncbi:hypothetical protein [Chitinophaga sp.]|uniref:hypothetical protein n=1 Tax=Chitinophaga sp. TaxID=1869181 RepID=UPI002618A467|nr:hypothetical protein [uncultured Chitinophaga sp.]
MKNRIMLMTLLLAAFTFAAQAQDSTHARGHRWDAAGKADKMSDKLYRELGLSKEQRKAIYDINEDIARKRDATKKDASISSRQRMQVYQQLDTERNRRFREVLSPSQYKKWNDWELMKKGDMEKKMDRKQDKKEARKTSNG